MTCLLPRPLSCGSTRTSDVLKSRRVFYMSASQAPPPSPPLNSLVPILISRGAAITLVLAFHHFVHYYPALSIITTLYIIISCSLSTTLYIIIRPTCNRFVVVKKEIKTMTPSMAYELGTMAYELAHGTRTCIKRKKMYYGKFFDFCADKYIGF